MHVKTIQDAAYEHMLAGTYKHLRFPDAEFALKTLRDRLDRLEQDLLTRSAPNRDWHISRRLLQTAGLCFRALMDLNLPLAASTDRPGPENARPHDPA